jgi:hypothetical protein
VCVSVSNVMTKYVRKPMYFFKILCARNHSFRVLSTAEHIYF